MVKFHRNTYIFNYSFKFKRFLCSKQLFQTAPTSVPSFAAISRSTLKPHQPEPVAANLPQPRAYLRKPTTNHLSNRPSQHIIGITGSQNVRPSRPNQQDVLRSAPLIPRTTRSSLDLFKPLQEATQPPASPPDTPASDRSQPHEVKRIASSKPPSRAQSVIRQPSPAPLPPAAPNLGAQLNMAMAGPTKCPTYPIHASPTGQNLSSNALRQPFFVLLPTVSHARQGP